MKARLILAAAICATLAGCGGVSISDANLKRDLQDDVAVANETEARWDTLTPAQQKTSFHGAANALRNLLNASNGKPATTQPQ